jgi:hypothetical protein
MPHWRWEQDIRSYLVSQGSTIISETSSEATEKFKKIAAKINEATKRSCPGIQVASRVRSFRLFRI